MSYMMDKSLKNSQIVHYVRQKYLISFGYMEKLNVLESIIVMIAI